MPCGSHYSKGHDTRRRYGVNGNESSRDDFDVDDDFDESEGGGEDTQPVNCKFNALIMTLYPGSIANWAILITLFVIFAFLILPEVLDEETNELVPDWMQSILLSVALYFPISFAYHYVTKYMRSE